MSSHSSVHPKRRGEPAAVYFSTQATKKPRTGVQQLHPKTRDKLDVNSATAGMEDADIDGNGPRPADMCGQFEEVVGALQPPRRRSSRPLSHIFLVPTEVRDTAFFDLNGDFEEQAKAAIRIQRQNTKGHRPSSVTGPTEASQSTTDMRESPSDGEPDLFYPYLDMVMDRSGFPLLKPYSPVSTDSTLTRDSSPSSRLGLQHQNKPETWPPYPEAAWKDDNSGRRRLAPN